MTSSKNTTATNDIGLTNDQYEKILKVATLYKKQAEKCREGKAYLAGCILMGAAFEAILLATAHCFEYEMRI